MSRVMKTSMGFVFLILVITVVAITLPTNPGHTTEQVYVSFDGVSYMTLDAALQIITTYKDTAIAAVQNARTAGYTHTTIETIIQQQNPTTISQIELGHSAKEITYGGQSVQEHLRSLLVYTDSWIENELTAQSLTIPSDFTDNKFGLDGCDTYYSGKTQVREKLC